MFKEFKNKVNKGRAGGNRGLSMGFSRLENILNGLHPHRYDVIFGEPGTGKSSFTWHAYILKPYEILINNPKIAERFNLKIKLYSLEVSREEVIAKMMCNRIYSKYGILLDPNLVFSRGKKILHNNLFALIEEQEKYFEELLSSTLEIIDKPYSPTQIKNDIAEFASERGRIKEVENGLLKYKPKDDKELVIIIVDTVGNLRDESINGRTSKKLTIDLHSEYSRDIYRNLYNYLVVNVSHANRSVNDTRRLASGQVFHQLSDIKETNMLAQDCNVAMCVFDPIRYVNLAPSMKRFNGYQIDQLRNRTRTIGILKNRNGINNVRSQLLFLGEAGYFQELDKIKEMNLAKYEKIKEIKGLSTLPFNEYLKFCNSLKAT